MRVLIDTSAWSLALRRDHVPSDPAVDFLNRTLQEGNGVTAGIILQELLQGVQGPKIRDAIVERFKSLPFLIPSRDDYVEAAALHTECRRKGIQVKTIDVLLATLCIRYDLTMLTKNRDFEHIARIRPFDVQGLG